METLKFKTTIKCSGCVAAVKPVLNDAVGADNWRVDIVSPEKILTIAPAEEVDASAVVKAIEAAGYKAERL
ncbi:heavy-metal-associated domain-containing protein [Flaviaesturariibacter flavus]|uniref:Heavy-metal-associated domain-containing protein n=1 Tax=Flaviaesturariibacter flavus TaxID=2502780 RepID=A0A4R1B7E0_9BACT|nr:heavy metal-associated domain-containing protein [Flaviaesturariibacter flavus]TCJ12155.1 heavy-metal-associated domain-containing protein [Flaviaesturariibacter flavus]